MRYKELLKSVFEITQKHREFNTSSFFRLGSFKFSKFETGYYISSSTVWKPFDFPWPQQPCDIFTTLFRNHLDLLQTLTVTVAPDSSQ